MILRDNEVVANIPFICRIQGFRARAQ
jgi:hypothetical protein